MRKISVITPAFNEEENLPAVHAELIPVLEGLGMEWEWIIIDDHSTDSTPDVIKGFARADSRIKGLRAAKNEGSHALCLFGFQKASGDCAVILSADGQDAPGNIARLVEEMKKTGSKVVWLTREGGRDDPFFKLFMARFYYFVMRRIMGVSSIPPSGGDMVLVDRAAFERLREIKGKNINILVAIAELGFPSSYVAGKRRARAHGTTNYTFVRNIGLFFDTMATLNSPAPMRRLVLAGVLTALTGLFYGNKLFTAVLVLGGAGMFGFGVAGEYLWHARRSASKQASFVVEHEIGGWRDSV
ncbi:MAG: glycosyltransferase family 2 protein [Candidatus Dadabacteria bacterium]|nr:glycosyltransferase family 2 protein [Candidatus Dadabacteria bacterium]